MKTIKIILVIISLTILFEVIADAQEGKSEEVQHQIISKVGDGVISEGSADYFIGKVEVQQITTVEPSRNTVAYVTFEAGARSNWHNHPAGQILVVTEGIALTGEWNSKVSKAEVGEVIYCPPDIKHWHGATATKKMTHVSVVESINGKNVNWLEPVSDKVYKEANKIVKR